MSAAVQLAPGFFECDAAAIDLRSVQVERCTYNVGVRRTVETPESTLALAYLQQQAGAARLNGELWLGHRLAIVRGTAEFSTTRPSVLTVVTFDPASIPISQAAIGGRAPGGDWFAMLPANDAAGARLEARIDAALAEPPSEEAAVALAERRIVASIISAVESALQAPNRVRRFEHRRAMADAAERYMWQHLGDEIGLSEICRGIGCRARTLINYFHSMHGMSPLRFLKIMRLNSANRALRAGNAARTTIFEIAADHGFWHMGHFSSDYRALFGKTPSETLHGA